MTLGLGLQLAGTRAFGGAGGSGYLDDVLSNVVMEFDFTTDPSGQLVTNRIASPADGSAQSDNDIYRGTDGTSEATDPSFSTDHFAFDGGDLLTIASGSNTSFLDSLHKTTGGSDWWIIATIYLGSLSNNNGIFTTYGAVNGPAVYVRVNSAGTIRQQQRGTSNSFVNSSTTTVAATTPIIIGVSHSHSTNETTFWAGSSTGEAISHTYDTTTDAAVDIFKIGTLGFSQFLVSGSRMYSFAMGNSYLTDSEMALAITHYETAHGRDYTP